MSERVVSLVLPTLHAAQAQIKREARRFNVLNCGRRFGKDILGHELLVDAALDGFPVAWFAPTYRMMLDTFREVANLLRPIATKTNASDHRIELVTGGMVDMWSLDVPDVARGRKYKRVIINEAAMVGRLEEAWQNVIRPTLADYQGGAFFLSTPRGGNFFKQIFSYGVDPFRSEWASWSFPTGANPYISPAEIEAMRGEMTERTYRQEILADFIEGEGAVFRNVRECATATADEPQAHAGHGIVFGVDWGQQHDYTVIVALCVGCRRMVDMDRYNQVAWSLQRGRLAAMRDKWQPHNIVAESNSIGGPNVEALQADGLPVMAFETTATSKPPLIQSLVLAFERNEIRILPDAVLLGELESYEEKRSAVTGRPTYSAPEGLHDDTVMALALAWHGYQNGLGHVATIPNREYAISAW